MLQNSLNVSNSKTSDHNLWNKYISIFNVRSSQSESLEPRLVLMIPLLFSMVTPRQLRLNGLTFETQMKNCSTRSSIQRGQQF